MNLFRKKGGRTIPIKPKNGEIGSKVPKEQLEIQKKLLENNVKEVELLKEYSTGKMTPMQLQDKLMPIEMERIDTAIKFSGIKIEKKEH